MKWWKKNQEFIRTTKNMLHWETTPRQEIWVQRNSETRVLPLLQKERLSDCFVYIPKKDGFFCIFCTWFLNADKRRSLGSFVNQGYREWHTIKEKESQHSGNNYHQQVVEEAYEITERFGSPMNTVPAKKEGRVKRKISISSKNCGSIGWGYLFTRKARAYTV